MTALGLHGPVKPKRFEEVLSGRIPGTATRLGRLRAGRHEHRPGLDITFSAPKSVSLEALVHAAPKASARIVRAHDEAVTATLDFIENELLETRGWDPVTRRRPRIRGHGLVAATFRHVASRNLDPQLHTHSVVANMTQNADGEWRSADFIGIERAKHLIGAHYRAELRRRLEALGYATVETMVGSVPGFEIAGYDRATLRAFSTRRAQALAWARERNLDSASAAVMQQAVLYTRKRKHEPSREELSRIWQARMAELAPRNRRLSRNRPASHTRLDRERWHLERRETANRRSPSALHAVRRAVEHLEERRTVFTADMLRALVLAPGRWRLPEIDAAIARLRTEGHLVEATRARSDLAFVTDRAVKAERAVVAWMKKESWAPALFEIDGDDVERHLAAGALNAGQRDAVATLLLSSSHLVGVQGHAGTGKTTMLREVVELAGPERIVAVAPSSSAARTLQRETGLGTKTLQWFLARYRDVGDGCAGEEALETAREALEGTLLVVDEASFVSMAQMHALARIAEATGIARVALVGDRAQLRSVEAGQPFRVLQKAGMETAVMDEVLRQRDESLRAAVLHMIAGKPDLALDELGPGVLEMDTQELGARAAALWLALDADSREATKVLAPTHARRCEITGSIREGLKAEGSLHGRTIEVERYVNLHLTRAQKGDLAKWREGDVAVFHAQVYGVQAQSGDIFEVIGSEDEKVLLKHPDGRIRRADPSKYLRYRVDLFETDMIELQAGERIRWTRNDKDRALINGEEARILWIGAKTLKLRTADGRTLKLAHDDPQLHFIDHAWTSTVHAAQGITCDAVIAVLDADQGAIAGQAAFYVELTRARDNAVLLTDDRDGLAEALETATGEELSALEAIGRQFRDSGPVTMSEKGGMTPQGLSAAQDPTEIVHATLHRHLDHRLAERQALLDRARPPHMDENAALAGTGGHDAWRDRTLATVAAWRDETGDERGAGAGKADLLEALVAFDDRLGAFNRDLRRHAQAANRAGVDMAFLDGIDDLTARGRALVETAPRPEEIPGALPSFLEMVAAAIRDHDEAAARADAEVLAGLDRGMRNLDAVKDERRALRERAQDGPLHEAEGYAAWRERAAAAVDAMPKAVLRDGERERRGLDDTRRLGETFMFDDEVAALIADWTAFENEARARGVEALDLAAAGPLLARFRRLAGDPPEGETPPRALTGILARHRERSEARKKAAAQIARGLEAYRACHQEATEQFAAIAEWRAGTKAAIDAWRATTVADERDAALSETAAVLENLVAFEERALDVAGRLRDARGDDETANPFLGAEGDALAADLHALEADQPGHAVMPPALRQALADLDGHGLAVARNAERERAAAAVSRALDDYAARHGRPGDGPHAQVETLRAWCNGTRQALDTWRTLTEAETRDPALAETAAALEALVAFEERARALLGRWTDAGNAGAGDGVRPFETPGGAALAADLRALEADRPRHGVMLPALRQALDEHASDEARIAERDETAAALGQALAAYRACHGPARDAESQLSAIAEWRRATQGALEAWRAMAETGDPLLSNRAAVLDDLVAFEGRAFDVARAWLGARRSARQSDPFLGVEGEALAAELRTLQAGRPLHAMMPHVLGAALERLAEHARAVARAGELIERAAEADAMRRSLLEREGSKSRPLNRRFNRAWTRWREAAEAVVADIDATDVALIADVDKTGVAARVREDLAASGRLDCLPGWLLLRLHDNARHAGSAMHPAMTKDYAGIVNDMRRFGDSLRENDPRRSVLHGEIHEYQALMEARRKVDGLLDDLKAHAADTAFLRARARREDLPLKQSMAWEQWYDESRRLEKQTRRVLTGGGDHRVVLHDGEGTRQAFEEAIARFAQTRALHGEPDDSVRRERERQEAQKRVRSWSQGRGRSRGLSM